MKAKKLLAVAVSMAIAATAAVGIAACGHEHTYTEWGHNNDQHWKYCPDDRAIDAESKENHTFDANGQCECGFTKPTTGGEQGGQQGGEQGGQQGGQQGGEQGGEQGGQQGGEQGGQQGGEQGGQQGGEQGGQQGGTVTPGTHTADEYGVGWYIVGTGEGSLKGVGWNDFEKEMKLQDDGNGYLSITLDLYNGDVFKFVYNDGTYQYIGMEDTYDWDNLSIGYLGEDSPNDMTAYCTNDVFNVMIKDGQSGNYTLKIKSTAVDKTIQDEADGVQIIKNSSLTDRVLTSDFYLIGTIKSKNMNNAWPDLTNFDTTKWCPIPGSNGTYSITLQLTSTDEFKVYMRTGETTGKYWSIGPGKENPNITGYEGMYTITVTTTVNAQGQTIPDVKIVRAS